MRTIYMRVLLGTQCPGHLDRWQQGCEDMLLSFQLLDGCHFLLCFAFLWDKMLSLDMWNYAFCELLWRMLSFSQSLYPVLGTCSGNELCWQSCAGKKVLSWLWKHVGECSHPQVAVLVIKHLISQVVWSRSPQVSGSPQEAACSVCCRAGAPQRWPG